MKTICCIISPDQLDAVCRALQRAGVHDFVVTEAREFACLKRSELQHAFGDAQAIELRPLAKVEVILADDLIDHVVQAMLRAASAHLAGDGTIFVSQAALREARLTD